MRPEFRIRITEKVDWFPLISGRLYNDVLTAMQGARYPIKTILGVFIAASLSLYSALDFYNKQIERNKAQQDSYQMGAQEERFEALKRELPVQAVVGYISDLPEPGILLSAQYALAPALLVDNELHQFVVGNFSKPMDYTEYGRARKLALVKDFGKGVVLFRKAD